MTNFDELIDEVEYYTREVANNTEWGMSTTGVKQCLSNARTALRAAILEVETERDALKEAMRWIPVDERLPEEGEYVSVLFGKDEKTVGSWFTETETEEYETIGFEYKQWEVWNFGDNKFKYVDNPPTHWMPLPAVPEGDVMG